MSNGLHIRLAVPDDAETIAAFNRAMALETENKTLNENVSILGVRAVLAEPQLGRYYVVSEGQDVRASLMITYEWSDWRNGLFWWVQSVYVHPERRRAGLFSHLYQFVKQEAQRDERVCGLRLYVERENINALATYRRLGMQTESYDIMEELF